MLHIFGVHPIAKMKPQEAHPKSFASHKNGLADHMWPAARWLEIAGADTRYLAITIYILSIYLGINIANHTIVNSRYVYLGNPSLHQYRYLEN
jgi:hypothetical protein